MGWESSYSWKSKAQVVEYVRSQFNASWWKGVNEGAWFVARPVGKPSFILLALIEKRLGMYYLKLISESERPYYYSCPVEFFALAPEANAEWRKLVEQSKLVKIARKAAKAAIQVGEVYELVGSAVKANFKVVAKGPKGAIKGMIGGQIYRIPAKMIGQKIQAV